MTSAPDSPDAPVQAQAPPAAPGAPLAAVPGGPPVVPVLLDGVVARDAAGPRGSSRGALQGVTAALGPGVNVFLGAPEDGTIALCDALAGVRRALRGSVRVAGHDPSSTPAVRGRIGALLAAPDLPEAASVRASVAQALAAMGRAASEAEGALAELGLGGLASRRPAALSFAEARAVELALALAAVKSAPPPAVVVLFEPCADVAVPGGARAIDDAIAGLRAAGACVVIATSSTADARRLADVLWIVSRGAIVRREVDGKALAVGESEVAAWVGRDGSAAVRALAAAVAQSPAVRSAFWEDPAQPGRPAVVRVRGPDRDACSLAVLDAAAAAGVAVEAITSSVPDLTHVRSAALARYQQAQAAARAQLPPPRGMAPPTMPQPGPAPVAPPPAEPPAASATASISVAPPPGEESPPAPPGGPS